MKIKNMRGCQYFAALLFLTPGLILYREFYILQQNIEPGLRISHIVLFSGSVRHGITPVIQIARLLNITQLECSNTCIKTNCLNNHNITLYMDIKSFLPESLIYNVFRTRRMRIRVLRKEMHTKKV